MATERDKELMALRLQKMDLQNRLRNAKNLNGMFADVEEKYKQQQKLCDQIASRVARKGSISQTVSSQTAVLSSSVDSLNDLTAKLDVATKASQAKQLEKFESLSSQVTSQLSLIQEQMDYLANCNQSHQFSSRLNDAKVSKTRTLEELVSTKASLDEALASERNCGELKQQKLVRVSDELSDLQDRNGEVEQKIRNVEDNIAELTDNSERIEGIVATLKRDCDNIEKEMQSSTTDEEFFLNEQLQQHSLELASYREKVAATSEELTVVRDEVLALSKQLPGEWITQDSDGCMVLKPYVVPELQSIISEKSREIAEVMITLHGSPDFVDFDPLAIDSQITEVSQSSKINDLTMMQSDLQNELSELKNKTLCVNQRIAQEEKIVLHEVSTLVAERDELSKKADHSHKQREEIENHIVFLESAKNEQEKKLEELDAHLTNLAQDGETYQLVTPMKPSVPQQVSFRRAARSADSDEGLETTNSNEIEGLSSFSPGTLKKKSRHVHPEKVFHRTNSKEVVQSSQGKNLSDLFRENDNDGGRMIVPDSALTQSSKGIGYPHNIFLNDSMTDFSRPTSYPAIVSNDAGDYNDEDSLMNSMISEQSVW